MGTPTKDFDYHLPTDLIAQHSAEPRDHSRLMVIERETGQWGHKRFYDLLEELRAGDVLVMNDTKVFRARLEASIQPVSLRRACPAYRQAGGRQAGGAPRRSPSDRTVVRAGNLSMELFLLRPRGTAWDVLVKPGRHVNVGDTIVLDGVTGRVLSKSDVVSVAFNVSDQALINYANAHGRIPIPPYVHEMPVRLEQYQTVYAKETGSVAAPTAGFHFTEELLEKIRAKGVEIHPVTLHVGLGTFRPMKSETIEAHEMHSEFVAISASTAQAINRAKQEGRRVIAVGTTTVRTLEGVVQDDKSLPYHGFSGDVNLFITPGFPFKIVDALLTNFHLPKSTLLVLVSAFAGREHILAAYHEAIREKYRFFSFGDAMFIR
jgi:S-adenosylmethionine:tRNA ribosyltransferase-isomerase